MEGVLSSISAFPASRSFLFVFVQTKMNNSLANCLMFLKMEYYFSTGKDFFAAAGLGDLDRLKELVEKKVNGGDLAKGISGLKDKEGQTVFNFAAFAGRKNICEYLVQELKLNVDDFVNAEGLTPLHSAILGEQHSVAVYLLDNGANPNATDNYGVTPLHMAAKLGNLKVLEYLIKKGAEIDAEAIVGTPLQLAASINRGDIMKVLLDNHANPNASPSSVWSPMHLSIKNESVKCVKLLLKAGADPNLFSQGHTPLGLVAVIGNTKIIECLLNAGADPNVPNHVGHKPLEVAAALNNRNTVMRLFPVTSRISSIADWSVDGILKFAASEDGTKEMTETVMKNLLRLKSNGYEAFKRHDYHEAIKFYTEILCYLPPFAASIHSNRSLCWARLNLGHNALEDARSCLKMRPDWPKAYYRLGAAWMALKKYRNAADAFYDGWKLDLRDKELEHAFLQAIEAQRVASST